MRCLEQLGVGQTSDLCVPTTPHLPYHVPPGKAVYTKRGLLPSTHAKTMLTSMSDNVDCNGWQVRTRTAQRLTVRAAGGRTPSQDQRARLSSARGAPTRRSGRPAWVFLLLVSWNIF